MNWIAKGNISVKWQIIFSFIPGILIWSFFRIKKLRLFLATMVAPVLIITVIVIPLTVMGPEHVEKCIWANIWWPEEEEECFVEEVFVLAILVELVYHGFKTYYIVKWTRKWNEQF